MHSLDYKIIKGTCPTNFGKMRHLQVEKNASFEKIATGKLLLMRFFGLQQLPFLTLGIKGTTVTISF